MVLTKDKYVAADSALGYLYQCRYALLAGLREFRRRPHLEISVERFDDIAFDESGDPKTLIQTKHQILKNGDLGDLSTDLWKTIFIWSSKTQSDPQFPFRVRLYLLTTTEAKSGTVASLLKITNRDEERAQRLLLDAAGRSKSASDKTIERFDKFRSLVPEQQIALLRAITIFDGAPNVNEVDREIREELALSVSRKKIDLCLERLEGWWYRRIVGALIDGQTSIPLFELDEKIDDIREGLARNTLPIDIDDFTLPTRLVHDDDARRFIHQMRLIELSGRRIELAARDFYRASEQRSRWAREELLLDDELGKYDRQLQEAWEVRFIRMSDALKKGSDHSARVGAGEALFTWAETEAEFPLRNVARCFLTHGSFQILADRGEIGWHPDFSPGAD